MKSDSAGKDEIPDGAGTEPSGAAKTGQAASRGWPGRVRVKATGLGRGSGGGLGRGGVLRLPHSQFCQIQRTRWAAPRRIPRIGQRRQGNIIVRRARRRARAVHHCGDHFCPRVGAATARELSLREKNGRRPHEIWARRSGHFSMPATALHRSKSYLSRPVAPFNAAGRTLFGPTRVPHDGSRIPPARSCPPLCLKVLCEPVDSCFSLKLLNGFYTKPV